MASSVVVGSGKLAETMAALLSSTGRRVALLSPSASRSGKLESSTATKILQEDSEAKVPFMFIDDLRHQQKHAQKNMDRITVTSDLAGFQNVDAIVDASGSAEETLLFTKAVRALPKATVISLEEKSPVHNNHVTLRLYEPIMETRTAKVLKHVNTSATAVNVVNNMLESLGIAVLSQEDSLVADRLVKEMEEVEKSSQLTKLMSALVHPAPSHVASNNVPREQYNIYW